MPPTGILESLSSSSHLWRPNLAAQQHSVKKHLHRSVAAERVPPCDYRLSQCLPSAFLAYHGLPLSLHYSLSSEASFGFSFPSPWQKMHRWKGGVRRSQLSYGLPFQQWHLGTSVAAERVACIIIGIFQCHPFSNTAFGHTSTAQ